MPVLYVVCPNCKTKNVPGRMHCLGCGNDLAALQPTAEEIRLASEPMPPASGTTPAEVIAAGHSDRTESIGEQVADWYRMFCVVNLLIVILATVFLLLAATARQPDMFSRGIPEAWPADVRGVLAQSNEVFKRQEAQERAGKIAITLVVTVPFVLLLAAGAFHKPSPGAWSLGVLILCLGLGGCSLPFAVILLIHWFKPEVRAYFDRGGAS